MITPGLDLFTDARGTKNCDSVPVGTEFQKFQKYRSILKDRIYPACLYKRYTLLPHDE